MTYKELNLNQKKQINSIFNTSPYHFEWEDEDFIEHLTGKLPEIRYYNDYTSNEERDKINKKIHNLRQIMDSYNTFWTDNQKELFVAEIEKKVSEICEVRKTWHGIDLYRIKECIEMQKSCLVIGNGGIGKSYFIKCLEERLEKESIEHLCIYGKFVKDIYDLDVEEIISLGKNIGFVFIVDAINEMSEEGQKELLEMLRKMSKNPKIHIVITCRTNTIDDNLLEEYKKIIKYEYIFPGVSFESALSELLKLPVPDIYLYEDILYSNNALFLTILQKVLTSSKVKNEEENATLTITYILEAYIKKLFESQGLNIWEDIKRVADWMYENNKRDISYDALCELIKEKQEFIKLMKQKGLMDFYIKDDTEYYYFVIDSLTDYLIARSLFNKISKKTNNEKIKIIKAKTSSMFWLKEQFIMVLFDQMKDDYKSIYDILLKTGLLAELDYNVLTKIHFKRDKIKNFLEVFNPIDKYELIHRMGGFTDKPFNCSNYLYDYYCTDKSKIVELSNTLSGKHFLNDIKYRLKNLLYFVTINNRPDRRDDEAFYFSILCCAAPNSDIRCLAMKLLYEIVVKDENFIAKLIDEYNGKINDLYIKESIIYILCKMKKNNNLIIHFFECIIKNEKYLTAKSIKRIAEYFDKPYCYIDWYRKSLYKYNVKAEISDNLNNILSSVDLYDKDFLPFKYFSKEHIEPYVSFLANEKDEINLVNNYLLKNYFCVRNGECKGSFGFERKVIPEIEKITKIQKIDINSFIESLGIVIDEIFKYYGFSLKEDIRYDYYFHSTYRKCIDIAIGAFYGSLMCNYYTDEFASFNNYQDNIGYEVYDPLKYGETEIITAPIPTYQDFIERLGDEVIKRIDVTSIKDACWHKNINLTKKNVLNLIKPINYKNFEWVLLAAEISIHEKENSVNKWSDNYSLFCCTSENETINADGNARYLTIELENYDSDLRQYRDNANRMWLCKRVKGICSNSDIFEQTFTILPPSSMIKYFNLTLNVSDLSWENQNKEKIIYCNNNKCSYYSNQIRGTVVIRKDYYNEFSKNNSIKYFAFAERYMKGVGYFSETDLHFELNNDGIIKMIRNNDFTDKQYMNRKNKCVDCKLYSINNTLEAKVDDAKLKNLEELLKQYGIDM